MSRAVRALGVAAFAAVGCAAPDVMVRGRPVLSPREGVRHEEGSFVGAGEVRIFQQCWRPASGPTRAVLVVVHGLKDHSTRYAALAQELALRGFCVCGLDLRGHGSSGGARVWVNWFDEYLDDLGAFLDRVRAAEPGRPVFVFGHSMGGAIVTLHAIERKSDIRGLVLSAPALKAGSDVSPFLIGVTRVLGGFFPTLAVLNLKDADFSRDARTVAEMQADPLVYGAAGPARTARELLGAIGRIQERMEAVEVPFLVLHGTEDRLTNPQGSRELMERARSGDKTLKLYQGLFHDLLHEPERDRVIADIVDWLEPRAPSGTP